MCDQILTPIGRSEVQNYTHQTANTGAKKIFHRLGPSDNHQKKWVCQLGGHCSCGFELNALGRGTFSTAQPLRGEVAFCRFGKEPTLWEAQWWSCLENHLLLRTGGPWFGSPRKKKILQRVAKTFLNSCLFLLGARFWGGDFWPTQSGVGGGDPLTPMEVLKRSLLWSANCCLSSQ